MSTSSTTVTPRQPTRWWWRTLIALLATGLMWWGVREVLRPQPVFEFQLESRWKVEHALQVGPLCIMETALQGGKRYVGQIQVLDQVKKTFTKNDTRFGTPYSWGPGLARAFINCLDRYIIRFPPGLPRSISMYDTATGEIVTHLLAADASYHISNDGTTVLESTTIPVAPFAALSPAPWSVVPTAFLMSCDAQRYYGYAIGPTLVQIRQLPEFKIKKRFALPLHVEVRTLHMTADGKHLLHGFGPTGPPYMNLISPGSITGGQPISGSTPDQQRIWDGLLLIFPEYGDYYRRWKEQIKAGGKWQDKTTENWVTVDVSNAWPTLSSSCDVYDAQTGELRNSVLMEENGQAVKYRCMTLLQDWAFISIVRPIPGEKTASRTLPYLYALHLPTGKKIPADQLPPGFWDTYTKLIPNQSAGASIGLVRVYENPQPTQTQRLFRRANPLIELHTFKADGTVQKIGQSHSHDFKLLVPYCSQMIVQSSLLTMLPDWCRKAVNQWPWLKSKLEPSRVAVVDIDSNSVLWSISIVPGTDEVFNQPAPTITRDGRLLLIPVREDDKHTDYEAYALPLSPWLPTWPFLAAGAVLLLLMSQGFSRLRLQVIRRLNSK